MLGNALTWILALLLAALVGIFAIAPSPGSVSADLGDSHETDESSGFALPEFGGYGLAMFVDENASSDEFILYMEEVTIPENDQKYGIYLTNQWGEKLFLGHAKPEICCGHAGEDEEDHDGDGAFDPHDGRLIFSYISQSGENLLANYSGVLITLGDESNVIFEDVASNASFEFIQALLVLDSANQTRGPAVRLKYLANELKSLSATEIQASSLAEMRGFAQKIQAGLGPNSLDALYRALDYGELAANQEDASPGMNLRLKKIKPLVTSLKEQFDLAKKLSSDLMIADIDLQTAHAIRVKLRAVAESMADGLLELYKNCQQMSWLAPSPKFTRER